MKTLTDEGRQKIDAMAARYNLKSETVETLLTALIRGNGTMAQFNLPELGGQGQWMKGGMTMVGDMFNNSLRTTVDKLCTELAELVTTTVLYESHDSYEQPDGANGANSGDDVPTGFFRQTSSSWPAVFGSPTASGTQNSLRYAYFAPMRRLVIEDGGKRTIYDTKHHQITGVAQQQGASSSYHFTSQEGRVDLASLEVVSDPDSVRQTTPEIPYDVTSTPGYGSEHKSPQDIVFSTIERLNVLFEKGQISEEEFKNKKQELLDRL